MTGLLLEGVLLAVHPPLPSPRTNRTRLVPPPVRTGRASSLLPYEPDAPLPSPRTNQTRLVPPPVPTGRVSSQVILAYMAREVATVFRMGLRKVRRARPRSGPRLPRKAVVTAP